MDHPLVSLTQPYPRTHLEEISREMGFATTKLEELPEKFNRKVSIENPEQRQIENIHKLFPLVVRWPWLLKLTPRLVRSRLLAPLYLPIYMLWSEYPVSEQNRLYRREQGSRSGWITHFADFVLRVLRKGLLRLFERLFARRMKRRRAALDMGDERLVAHMD